MKISEMGAVFVRVPPRSNTKKVLKFILLIMLVISPVLTF
jgi:hypothetical protein